MLYLRTLINKVSHYLILQESQCTQLEKPDAQLQTYTVEAVRILGSISAQAQNEEQNLQLIVHVVDGQGPSLLERN